MTPIRSKALTSLQYPLSPGLLVQLGAFDDLPEVGLEAGALSGTASYVMWSTYGHWNPHDGNRIFGCLRLARSMEGADGAAGMAGIESVPGAPGDGSNIMLAIEQKVLTRDKTLEMLRTEAVCQGDALATPISWEQSVYVEKHPSSAPERWSTERVELRDGELHVSAGGRDFVRPAAGKGGVSSNWGLLDVIERLELGEGQELHFSMMEELKYLRGGHRLRYDGLCAADFGRGERVMHRYTQMGSGVHPITYWLDEERRLRLAYTGRFAYIRDGAAESKFAAVLGEVKA
jgi:hypothetical protein